MKPVKMSLQKNLLEPSQIKYHKSRYGLNASRDGVVLDFEDGSYEHFVVYKSKTPIFGCVVDNGKEYIFENFEGDFKFSKKDVKDV